MNEQAKQIAALEAEYAQVQDEIDRLPTKPGEYIDQTILTVSAKRRLPALITRRDRINTALGALYKA